MKYNSEPFVIDKAYSQALQRKVRALLEETHTTKAIHITMITLSGLVHNAYWNDIQQELTVDDLLK